MNAPICPLCNKPLELAVTREKEGKTITKGYFPCPKHPDSVIVNEEVNTTEFIMKKYDSSVIRYMAWFQDILYILMGNGKLYPYVDVPKEEYLDGLNWPSLGNWYNTRIKGKFEVLQ